MTRYQPFSAEQMENVIEGNVHMTGSHDLRFLVQSRHFRQRRSYGP